MTTDQSQQIAQLETEIAALQQVLAALASLPDMQRPLQQQLEDKQQQMAALRERPLIVGPVSAARDVNIATQQTITYLTTVIYGADPTYEQREQLARCLQRLTMKLQRLLLRGLAAHLDEGQGILLPKIYVMLATTAFETVDELDTQPRERVLEAAYDPDQALPHRAIIDSQYRHVDPATGVALAWDLKRSRITTEAVARHARLVILGDPGSGKSTFVRYLAWALACQALGEYVDSTMLFGWTLNTFYLPVLLPLRRLAGRIAQAGATPATVSAALRDELEREYDMRAVDSILDRALANGSALLLFDGLDEVPLQPVPGISADRTTTLQAISEFAALHSKTRVVLTCRTRTFGDALRKMLGWPVETLAPFTLGQIRHFASEWYAALATYGAIDPIVSKAYTQTLISTIVDNKRIRAMAANPLLLTMMALIVAEQGALPRDRPLLCERIIQQLLSQWDQQKGGQSLAETVGVVQMHSVDLRPIFDRLSFEAHAAGSSSDGRGRLTTQDLRYALASFFEADHIPGAWEAAGRCLDYFNERSGLILRDPDGTSYTFAHLMLQEYGAGRHMLLQPNALELVLQSRADDRWREPIDLGVGVILAFYPMLADRIDRILTELIDPDEGGQPKSIVRWYRDLILAAELGQERDWERLRPLIAVDRLCRDLRRGLVTLLSDTGQPLPINERVHAGFLLGDLGDPRFPVTLADWRDQIDYARIGRDGGYFCRVPQTMHNRAFWIGRYPITNHQVNEWQQAMPRSERPPRSDRNFNRPNQPAVGVSWWLASAFCHWLSEATGAAIRLPSELEWEYAAGGLDRLRYPWGNQRLRDRAATKEDHELRGWPYTVPVGCYPAGASAVGALDMAGNVWEWTSNVWGLERAVGARETKGLPRTLCGGGYLSKKRHMLVGARIGLEPSAGLDTGFRVILEADER